MRTPTPRRPSPQHADAVGMVAALLERYPHIATINSDPLDRSVTFSFAVSAALDKAIERELRESIGDHVRALLAVTRDAPDRFAVDVDSDAQLSFVRVTRDARSLSREELHLITALLGDRFGTDLVHSAPALAEASVDGDDGEALDEVVEYALDALRDPASQRSLVGFREEMRVMVYFVKSRKKPKARARN